MDKEKRFTCLAVPVAGCFYYLGTSIQPGTPVGQVNHVNLNLDGQARSGAPCLASVFQLQLPSPERGGSSKGDFGNSVTVDCLKRLRVLNVK